MCPHRRTAIPQPFIVRETELDEEVVVTRQPAHRGPALIANLDADSGPQTADRGRPLLVVSAGFPSDMAQHFHVPRQHACAGSRDSTVAQLRRQSIHDPTLRLL